MNPSNTYAALSAFSASSFSSGGCSLDLFTAVEKGDVQRIRTLAKEGADMNSPLYRYRGNALFIAVTKGLLETIRTLVELGADVNATLRDCLSTPIFYAVHCGVEEVIVLLMELGADVNVVRKDGVTPLYQVVEDDDQRFSLDIIRTMVGRGADLNVPVGDDNITPLYLASHCCSVEVIALLLELGADANFSCDKCAHSVYIAAQVGRDDVVKMLVAAGGDINKPWNHDFVAMHVAACYGKANVIETLRDLGADLNAVTEEKSTPLLIAARFGHVDVICKLVELGVDVNYVAAETGITALYEAARRGQSAVVLKLIELGANANICSFQGTSPLYVAAENGHGSVVRAFVEDEVNINASPFGHDTTPILIACVKGHTCISKILLQNGADLSLCLSKNRNREEVNHIYDIVDKCTGQFAHLEDDYISRGCLVSLSKLIFQKTTSNPEFSRLGGLSSVVVENYLILHLEDALSSPRLKCLHNTPHVLKSKLLSMSCRSFFATLPANGSALNPEMMMQRCVHLACLFLDLPMVREVLALRMTCKSNCDRMRFPTCRRGGKYEELEVNVIEEWLCYGSSRLASTKILFQVLREHEFSEEKQSLNKKNDS